MLIEIVAMALAGAFCFVVALGHFLLLAAVWPGLLRRCRDLKSLLRASRIAIAAAIGAALGLSLMPEAKAQPASSIWMTQILIAAPTLEADAQDVSRQATLRDWRSSAIGGIK